RPLGRGRRPAPHSPLGRGHRRLCSRGPARWRNPARLSPQRPLLARAPALRGHTAQRATELADLGRGAAPRAGAAPRLGRDEAARLLPVTATVLPIETFSNATGGNVFYKAIGHPLAAEAAAGLVAELAANGPVAIFDTEGQAA